MACEGSGPISSLNRRLGAMSSCCMVSEAFEGSEIYYQGVRVHVVHTILDWNVQSNYVGC